MKALPGVSVVVCCHNSAQRLPVTLDHLANQQVRSGVLWEVLVVDNGSTDSTGDVARQLWPANAPAPLRVVQEPQIGQAYARLRGLAEASYELLGFIDDDNWVADDWVEMAALVASENPQVGIFGSEARGAYETPPPQWFPQCQFMYGVSPADWATGEVNTRGRAIWGAGMVVRKPAWQDLRRQNPPQLLTGRRGRSMAAGEDAELCHQFQLAGWRLRYDSRLSLHHYMTANRLSWDYARRLHYGAGESSAKLAPYQEVLCGFPKRKSDWLWQTLLAAKLVLRHPLRLLRLPLRLGEGDVMTLGTELALGQLSALLSSRGSYAKNRREVMAFAVRAHGRSWVSADMHRQIDATPRDAQS